MGTNINANINIYNDTNIDIYMNIIAFNMSCIMYKSAIKIYGPANILKNVFLSKIYRFISRFKNKSTIKKYKLTNKLKNIFTTHIYKFVYRLKSILIIRAYKLTNSI